MRTAPLLTLPLVAASLLLTACPDPGEGKAKAVVQDAPAAPDNPAVPADAPAAKPPAPAAPEGALPFGSPSKIGFVGANVTSKQPGVFETFTGWFVLDGNMPKAAEVTIDMGSVKTGPDKLTKHLKSEDFFHVEAHPTATFKSTKIEEGGDHGATHIIGTTKRVTFPVTFTMTPERVQMTADFAINRKDFGIMYKGSPDNLLADNVAIQLDVSAAKAGAK